MPERPAPGGNFLTFTRRPLVMVESPFFNLNEDLIRRNIEFAKECMLHSLTLGEAPFLGHLLYTQVLNDHVPGERAIGLEAHLSWLTIADGVALYIDHGTSPGMVEAKAAAEHLGIPLCERRLYHDSNLQVPNAPQAVPDYQRQTPWASPFDYGIYKPRGG